MNRSRPKWFLPAFILVLGLVVGGAQWHGGHLGRGLGSLGLLAAFALAVLLGGRTRPCAGCAATVATSASR